MAKITSTDSLFVTVILCGKSLLCERMSGFESLRDLMIHLRKSLGQYAGQLLTLELRNSTRGWSRRDSLLFAA